MANVGIWIPDLSDFVAGHDLFGTSYRRGKRADDWTLGDSCVGAGYPNAEDAVVGQFVADGRSNIGIVDRFGTLCFDADLGIFHVEAVHPRELASRCLGRLSPSWVG